MDRKDGFAGSSRTRHYRDLLDWQKAMALANDVYRETGKLPQKETFGLQSQMRRAAVSIPSNIAEGHGRLDDGHFRQFLANACGSLYELETQLELSANQNYMDEEHVAKLMAQCDEIAKMINGLLSKLGAATSR